jgi:hypothetical protein
MWPRSYSRPFGRDGWQKTELNWTEQLRLSTADGSFHKYWTMHDIIGRYITVNLSILFSTLRSTHAIIGCPTAVSFGNTLCCAVNSSE